MDKWTAEDIAALENQPMTPTRKDKMQTEIPNGMALHSATRLILEGVEKRGYVIFDIVGDGLDAHIVLKQLKEIAGNVGYKIFNFSDRDFVIVNRDHAQFPVIHLGDYKYWKRTRPLCTSGRRAGFND